MDSEVFSQILGSTTPVSSVKRSLSGDFELSPEEAVRDNPGNHLERIQECIWPREKNREHSDSLTFAREFGPFHKETDSQRAVCLKDLDAVK